MSDVHSGAGPCYIVDASGQAYVPVVAGPGCTPPPGSEPFANFCFGYQSEQGWVSQPYIVGYSYAVMPAGNEGSDMMMVPILQSDDSASLQSGGVHTTDNHRTPEAAAASPLPTPTPSPTGADKGDASAYARFDGSFDASAAAAAGIVRGPQGGQGPCLWASPEHGVTPSPLWVVSDSQYTNGDTGVRQDPNLNPPVPSSHRARPEGSRRTSRADRRRRGQLRHLAAAAEQRALEAKKAAEEAERLAAERARKLNKVTHSTQTSTPPPQKIEKEIPEPIAVAPMPVKSSPSGQSSRSDECHSDSTEASAGPDRERPAPKLAKEKAVVTKSKEPTQLSGALAAHKAKVAWVPPPARVETPPERVAAKVLLRAYRNAGAALFPRQPKAKKGKKAPEPKTKQPKKRQSAEAPAEVVVIADQEPQPEPALEKETQNAEPAPVSTPREEQPGEAPSELRKEESKPQMHDLGDAISEAVLAELAQDLLDETESTLASSRGGFLAEDGTVCSDDAQCSEAGDGKSVDVMHSMMLGSALLSGSAPRLQLLLWQMSRH